MVWDTWVRVWDIESRGAGMSNIVPYHVSHDTRGADGTGLLVKYRKLLLGYPSNIKVA